MISNKLKRWWYRNRGIHILFRTFDWNWTALEPYKFGTIRMVDSATQWSNLNPAEGVYNFKVLDRIMAEVGDRYNFILNIFGTPRWCSSRPDEMWKDLSYTSGRMAPPTDLKYLEMFLREILTRFPQIKYIEGWNEPSVTNHWTGTVAEMVAVQETIYRISQEFGVTVLSPPCGANPSPWEWLDEFFNQCSAFDIVAKHLYAPDFEQRERDVATLKALLSKHGIIKPVWNSETGFYGKMGGDFQSYPESCRDALMTALFEQMKRLNIERTCFFSWNNSDGTTGFIL